MIDFEIIGIDGHVYHLMETFGKIYDINLKFWDIEEKPQVRRSYINEFEFYKSYV